MLLRFVLLSSRIANPGCGVSLAEMSTPTH